MPLTPTARWPLKQVDGERTPRPRPDKAKRSVAGTALVGRAARRATTRANPTISRDSCWSATWHASAKRTPRDAVNPTPASCGLSKAGHAQGQAQDRHRKSRQEHFRQVSAVLGKLFQKSCPSRFRMFESNYRIRRNRSLPPVVRSCFTFCANSMASVTSPRNSTLSAPPNDSST